MSYNKNYSIEAENDPNSPWNQSPIENLDNWTEDNFEIVLKDIPLYYGDDDSRAE